MGYYDYIAHYGVPGMKKGLRRWTNADGTLNEAGKARYRNRTSDPYPELRAKTSQTGNTVTTQYKNQKGDTVFETSRSGVGDYKPSRDEKVHDVRTYEAINRGKKAAGKLLKTKLNYSLGRTKKSLTKTGKIGKNLVASLLGGKKKKK